MFDVANACSLTLGYWWMIINWLFICTLVSWFLTCYIHSYFCLQVDIAAGGWHSTALTSEGEVFHYFDFGLTILYIYCFILPSHQMPQILWSTYYSCILGNSICEAYCQIGPANSETCCSIQGMLETWKTLKLDPWKLLFTNTYYMI